MGDKMRTLSEWHEQEGSLDGLFDLAEELEEGYAKLEDENAELKKSYTTIRGKLFSAVEEVAALVKRRDEQKDLLKFFLELERVIDLYEVIIDDPDDLQNAAVLVRIERAKKLVGEE